MRAMREIPSFGTFYGAGEQPSYITDTGVEIWMHREGKSVRFFDRAGNQIGPEHSHVHASVCWAFAAGWNNPSNPQWLNDGCQLEARDGKPPAVADVLPIR
jgi:hypothetical protein